MTILSILIGLGNLSFNSDMLVYQTPDQAGCDIFLVKTGVRDSRSNGGARFLVKTGVRDSRSGRE